jgi:uncharacterized protein (DUF2235 family)
MKRIVICADGTWNVRDQMDKETGKRRPSNVTKIARAVRARAPDGVDQVVFYHDGICTEGGTLDKLTDGAFGHGMEENIRTLYRFILYNHEPGDELYFFGFSRGAFTVRSLAGFMNLVGLIEKDDDYYVPEIYKCYEKGKGPGTPEWQKAFRKVKTVQPCPPIRLIGVWDTVGALGAPKFLGHMINADKYAYHKVGLFPSIQNACHALAIDERRRPFEPDIWERPAGWNGKLEQAWFCGVHTNVGGGYTMDGLANEALHWIVEKAEREGLVFDSAYLAHFEPHFTSILRDSMSVTYRLRARDRVIGAHRAHGECIHQSVVSRRSHAASKYDPAHLRDALGGASPLPVVQTTRIASQP